MTATAFKKDFLASIPVFLIGIPLCLAVAHASGMPLIAGLLGGVIGGVVASAISRSRFEVTGPSAALVALSVMAMHQLPNFQSFLLALFFAGLIQVILGLLQAGFLARFVPSAVTQGMIFAVGLVLVMKEFPHLLGYDIEEFGLLDFYVNPTSLSDQYPHLMPNDLNTIGILKHSFSFFHTGSMLVGLISLLPFFVLRGPMKNRFGLMSASLISLAAGTFTALALNYSDNAALILDTKHLVNIPNILGAASMGEIFRTPDFSQILNPAVYKVSLMIAIAASIESLLTIQILESMAPNRKTLSFSHELVAQGLGNTASGMLGGIPISSSLARGVVNLNAGAMTKNSGVLQGAWILIAVLFLPQAMNHIPIASLAAILIATGFQLVSLKLAKDNFRRGWQQFLPFTATIAGILFVDFLIGILAGLFVAFTFILRSSYYDSALAIAKMGKVTRITLGDDASFMLSAKLAKLLNEIEEGSIVEIDAGRTQHIDPEIIDMIRLYKKEAKLKNIVVVTGGIKALENEQLEVFEAMDNQYDELIKNNRDWVAERTKEDPEFFKRLGQGQAPQFLFIGCSDSRVPLETITKAEPGEMFIHRNIANVVNISDVNFLSVLQYSVEVLNVRHIIVCGHYECGGVKTALAQKSLGLIDNWILNVKMSFKDHQKELTAISDPYEREKRAIELHAIQQAQNLNMNPVVQRAVAKYGFPKIHSWVYDIKSGLIKDLEMPKGDSKAFDAVFKFDL